MKTDPKKDYHSKIFPLNFLITNSDSFTLTGFEEFLVSLVCSVTDNVDSIGVNLLKARSNLIKARSNFTNTIKGLSSLGIISSSSFSLLQVLTTLLFHYQFL